MGVDGELLASRILVVDDEESCLQDLRDVLKGWGFTEVVGTCDVAEGLGLLRRERPDLVMLDMHLPDIEGLGLLSELGDRYHGEGTYLPVLVLADDASEATKLRTLALGAHDYVTKPFSASQVRLRATHLLETRRLHRQVERHSRHLEHLVTERTSEVVATRHEVLDRLALAAEFRDDDTKAHTRRVGHNTALVAQSMGMSPTEVHDIRRAAPLHDLGKIGIPDHVLLKPGKLTEEEFEIIKTHSVVGARILDGTDFPLLEVARQIAIAHHERFDGTGYPNGLRGEAIPLVARMTSVIDVFDALVHERCYKPAWPTERAVEEITSQAGRQFDPDVVEVFVRLAADERLQI